MMLSELSMLLAAGTENRAASAIIDENLLGKPSLRAREAALMRLRQLYGFGEDCLICTVVRQLWNLDPTGRPLLALLWPGTLTWH